jgi:hypothetical protein
MSICRNVFNSSDLARRSSPAGAMFGRLRWRSNAIRVALDRQGRIGMRVSGSALALLAAMTSGLAATPNRLQGAPRSRFTNGAATSQALVCCCAANLCRKISLLRTLRRASAFFIPRPMAWTTRCTSLFRALCSGRRAIRRPAAGRSSLGRTAPSVRRRSARPRSWVGRSATRNI